MGKRNSVDSAMNALSAGDKSAIEAKEAALRAIPAPTFVQVIAFAMVVIDRLFNVRDEASYARNENKELIASLRDRGLEMRGGDNMTFSRQTDGTLKVIAGHLRFTCICIIREDEAKRRAAEGIETTDANPLPFENLFGLVFDGLTADQEVALMADHIGRKNLNEFEICKEIGEFVQATALTDAKAAIKFGMDKNKVRRIRMRYAMPNVFAEYRKEKSSDGKAGRVEFVKVGNEQLEALYTAYLADIDAGNAYRCTGPNFLAAWNVVISNPDAYKRATKEVPPTAKPRESIEAQAKGLAAAFGNNPEIEAVRGVLNWAGDITVDGKAPNLTDAVGDLVAYIAKIRDERDKMTDTAVERGHEIATLKETIVSLEARVKELETELSDKPQTSRKSKAK